MNDGTPKLLYNGLDQTEGGHEIEISEQDLGATLTMTKPQTVTYTPVTNSFTSSEVVIVKNKYWISNENTNLNIGDEFIYLIPASAGNNKAYDAADKNVDTFYFKYEDGDYLLHNLKKGGWNEKTSVATNSTDFVNNDNRMFISFYNKDGNTMELRKVPMGIGVGTHMITSDKDGNLKFMSASQTGSVDETEFINSKWTFIVKCVPKTTFINKIKEDAELSDGLIGIVTKRCDESIKCNEDTSTIFTEVDTTMNYEYLESLIPDGVSPIFRQNKLNRANWITTNVLEPMTYSDACTMSASETE